jgi:salicylate hydroxylase
MAENPILIAGGGIAGLAAALGLARKGRPCLVLERSAHFDETGAGIQLGPNAVKALKWLGAWDEVSGQAFAPRRIMIRDGVSGRLLQRIELGPAFERRFGEPYRVAHRADLQRGLLAAAANQPLVAIEAASEVTSCMSDGRGIRVECAGGSVHRGPALVAADGIHSRIRDRHFEPAAATAQHHQIYRTLLPVFGGLSDDAAESVCLWLCPGGHVVHYPVRAGAMLNIVAATEQKPRTGAANESASNDDVLAAFSKACEGLRLILALPNEWRWWPGSDRPPQPGWSRSRITLVGDAAHAALPYLAQGAAMALEDACAIAQASAGFSGYEQKRYARTARIQSASRRIAKMYHAHGAVRHARNAVLRSLPSDRFLDRMAWIYGHDPTAP